MMAKHFKLVVYLLCIPTYRELTPSVSNFECCEGLMIHKAKDLLFRCPVGVSLCEVVSLCVLGDRRDQKGHSNSNTAIHYSGFV